jgi:tRNA(Ile)-lysidine synthetase, N-terminal domain/tRNA(Ile)-lysidine synthetase, C-terminal domain
MIRKIYDYINENRLIEKGDRILIGVSGGADSVCLMHVLHELYKDTDVKLFVAHVHHGIRDKEADNDKAYVKELCDNLGIPFCAYHYDVKSIAKSECLSEEEAGRKVRYEAFYDASVKYNCNKVATAHNKNDNAETILLNLFRGSGIKGLTGMKPMNAMKTDTGSITIIRPLLFVTRKEIEAYLKEKNLSYRTDSTNLQNIYTRNKIRNVVLDYAAREINSNVIEHITNTGTYLNEIQDFIEKCTEERYKAIVRENPGFYEYAAEELCREPIVVQKGIVLKIFGKLAGNLKDIEARHVQEVLSLSNKQVGKEVHLPYGMVAVKKYDVITICKRSGLDIIRQEKKPVQEVDIRIPGRTYLEQYGIFIETEFIEDKNYNLFPKNSCIKWFDYDKIENTLKIRTRKAGDYLQINNRGGRKKLKDYFIDEKIPKEERDQILLVADGSHILWILGYGNRMSENYKVTDKTKKILSMKIICAKEKQNGREY